MEIEINIRSIKNGFIFWNNSDFDSIYCRDQGEVIEKVSEKIKKYVK